MGTAQEAHALMRRAARARAVEATAMNAESSRSHSAFMLHITGRHAASDTCLQGALNLVDLAGRCAWHECLQARLSVASAAAACHLCVALAAGPCQVARKQGMDGICACMPLPASRLFPPSSSRPPTPEGVSGHLGVAPIVQLLQSADYLLHSPACGVV